MAAYITVFDGLREIFEVTTMKKINRLGCLFIMAGFATALPAQSGGSFLIEKSVIASGDGRSMSGLFTLDGTVGEHFAGTAATGGQFELDRKSVV